MSRMDGVQPGDWGARRGGLGGYAIDRRDGGNTVSAPTSIEDLRMRQERAAANETVRAEISSVRRPTAASKPTERNGMMSPLNRLRAALVVNLGVWGGSIYAGVKAFPKHPILGGLGGAFILSPAIAYVTTMVIAPDAAQTIASLMPPRETDPRSISSVSNVSRSP